MRIATSTANARTTGWKKNYFLTGFLLIAFTLLIPMLIMTCDSTSMWDHLNQDLVSSRLTVDLKEITLPESPMQTSACFHLNMLEKPTDLVIIGLSVSDTSEAYIPIYSDVKDTNENYTGPHLEFTADDWMNEKSVFMVGVNDSEKDGTVTSHCVLKAISADSRYNGFTWEPVTITSLDDEIDTYYAWVAPKVVNSSFNSIVSTGTRICPVSTLSDDRNFLFIFPNGFKFRFITEDYDQVYITTNGMITFDSKADETSSPIATYDNTDLFAILTGPKYVIAPWWDDLKVNVADSQIYWELTGTIPNRVLTVEWYNVSSKDHVNPVFNFQVKLYETSNVIEMIYGPTSNGPDSVTRSASIGIKGLDDYTANYIDGTTGSSILGNADLDLADFPAPNTVITFTPK